MLVSELASDLPQDVYGDMFVKVCPYFIYAAHLECLNQKEK